MNPNYFRVIPRDLFNEAKLLKCLGQLVLHKHDGWIPNLSIEHEDPEEGFQIWQDNADGDLSCSSLNICIKGMPARFFTKYNSKEPYPLMCEIDDISYHVLTSEGDFTEEFKELCA